MTAQSQVKGLTSKTMEYAVNSQLRFIVCPWYGKGMTYCASVVQKQQVAPKQQMTSLPYTK
jgi:hypothetical protein